MRCYQEQTDYELEDLGDGEWLTGCPCCGLPNCGGISQVDREIIDKELDALKMVEVLEIIQGFNGLNNDRDMYLHNLVIWALGGEDITEKPKPEDYGL